MDRLYIIFAGILGNESGLGLPSKTNAPYSKILTIIYIVLTIVGALAILMIAVAGLQFVTSQGDPQKAARARNAIIYACIGLVVAGLSFIIVEFMVSKGAL